jgi:hypothetical protein
MSSDVFIYHLTSYFISTCNIFPLVIFEFLDTILLSISDWV